MKILSLIEMLRRVAPAIFAFAALATFIAPVSADLILFQDTFTYPNPSTTAGTPPDYSDGYSPDLNTAIGYAGRQSGSLVDSGGPIAYTQANHGGGAANGYSGAQNGSSQVIQAWIGAMFSPNVNFNNEKSAGGLVISYDAANWGPWDGDYQNLALFSIGLDAPPTNDDPQNIAHWTTPHLTYEFGFGWGFGEISADGLYDSGTAVAGGQMSVSVYDYGLHHVDMVCTDPGDGNPFDGVGQTNVDVFVDGVLQRSCVKGDGGYANNYITLGGYEYVNCAQEWDNLTVKQIPEPSTLVLLAMGLMVWFCRKRR